MKHRRTILYATILLTMFLHACGGSTVASTNKRFDIVLQAISDDGSPVAGAKFTAGKSHLGDSDKEGAVKARVRGAEGQTVPVRVECPEGFIPPEQPAMVRLTEVRRVNQDSPASLELQLTCTRKVRDLLVVVRTNQVPGLPVDVGGKTVGATDERGNAHIYLALHRDVHSLSVSLGTADAPTLRPQNPARVFELDDRDALVLLDQTFSTDRRVRISRRGSSSGTAPRHIPYRIGSR